MKRCLAMFLMLSLLWSVGFADIDLSSMSFDQLADLRNQILHEMMTRDDWQQVLVPVGTYKVGEHIPAGHWTISALPQDTTIIYIGQALEDDGKEVEYGSKGYYKITLTDDEYMFYRVGEAQQTDLVLTPGTYVEVKISGCLFTPYTGTNGLGFTFK